MRTLLDFLYRRRAFAVFLCLQALSWWLIVQHNQRHNADFLNSSNTFSANVSVTSQNISDYFELEKINKQLSRENEYLQSQLNSLVTHYDTIDTIFRFSVVGARVVNNTFRRSKNYLTIDVGKKDNISPGMGVVSPFGVVGQVKAVSQNYATVYSLLHPNVMVSSIVKRTNTNATVQWDQREYNIASLKYVPRHIEIMVGDTIVTSGFNSVFPSGINVGIVSEINLEDHMTFYDAQIELSTDFTSLPNVFVIVDEFKVEKDSIEALW